MVSVRGRRGGPGKNREARGEEQGRSRTGRKERRTRKWQGRAGDETKRSREKAAKNSGGTSKGGQ